MGSRNGSSSSRSSGGVNTSGNPLDTVVVISGDGRKEVLGLFWSYGANGSGIPPASLPLYGRLIVIAGVDASGYLAGGNLPTGIGADGTLANGLASYGGRVVFDEDVVWGTGTGSGSVNFNTETNEGWVGTDSGPITLILTAPQRGDGVAVTGIQGKLNVQYRNVYGSEGAADGLGYNYQRVSRPPR